MFGDGLDKNGMERRAREGTGPPMLMALTSLLLLCAMRRAVKIRNLTK